MRESTVLFRIQRLVDDVVVVHICLDVVVLQLNSYSIGHRNESIVVARRACNPVLAEIGEHIDVVPQKIDKGSTKRYGECPLALFAPSQRGW